MFTDYFEEVEAASVEELTRAILVATQEIMRRHGNDPRMPVVVSAAFAYSLEVIGEGESSIPPTVRGMLDGMSQAREGTSTSRH